MPNDRTTPDPALEELKALLDEEVGRLPEKYRKPMVLCGLQGKTYTEAARLLGWPEGTVSGRLARARDLLRQRLIRRGAVPSTVATALAASAAEAAPTALVHTTIKTALAFAAGAGGAAGSAAVLAEGVMRAMIFTKIKSVLAVVLTVAVVGTGVGFAARHNWSSPPDEPKVETPPPPAPKAKDERRPPLPAAWAERWVTDPFAGAEKIQVTYGSRVVEINEARDVAALLKTVKIEMVQNDIAIGSIPPAHLKVYRKDGSIFRASIESGDGVLLSSTYGLFSLHGDFITELNRQYSRLAGEVVELRKFIPPAAPAGLKPVPIVPPSERSLTAGFTALEVQYRVGQQAHKARFTDAKLLDALHKTLTIVKRDKPPVGKGGPPVSFTALSKDGSTFHGQVVSAEEFFDLDAGRFTVLPAFVKALAKEVGRLEGREIDLVEANVLTEPQVRREKELRALLAEVRTLRFQPKNEGVVKAVVVDKPEEVAALLAELKWVEVPVKGYRLEKGRSFLELTLKDGKTRTVTFLKTGDDNELVEASPLSAALVDVSGFGPVWIKKHWDSSFEQIAYRREQEEKGRRTEETTRLVCRDLPAFWKQAINVVAHYREGDNELAGPLTAEESRPILDALAGAKVEALDWTTERWINELRQLDERGAGMFRVAPGLGFNLKVLVSGENSMLIAGYGRLTFAESPIPACQKAINADDPKAVRLVPRGRKEQ